MARDLYIVPKGLHMHHGSKFGNFHGMPLNDKEDIVSVLFTHDASRDEWERVRGVQVIGNENSSDPVHPDVANKLSEFGVVGSKVGDISKLDKILAFLRELFKMSVAPVNTVRGHTARDVRKIIKAARKHPLF
ncbi:MAG: hypothetical protein WBD25_10180 [Terriglobales bacterium]|jgi:hypothetical protein